MKNNNNCIFKKNTTQVPGRMGLLVTLFLISSNVYSSLEAPIQRGFSYIEIFLVATQGIILFAIMEYGFVLAWKKCSNINRDDNKPQNLLINEQKLVIKKLSKSHQNNITGSSSWFDQQMTQDTKIKIIDMISLVISLTLYALFNVFYWINAYLYDHE